MKNVSDALRADLQTGLGGRVRSLTPVSGGDIHLAFRADLDDGRCAFVKANPHSAPGLFAAEAAGLRFLAEAAGDALVVPEVLGLRDRRGDDRTEGPGWLALGWLDFGGGPVDAAARQAAEAAMGRGLAALHGGAVAPPAKAFIGPLPQDNAGGARLAAAEWPRFYAERRLRPMLVQAGAALRRDEARAVLDLCEAMLEVLGGHGPLGALHGDLWAGNAALVRTETGAWRPAIFDPAASRGDPELDLAMMALFGGFSPAVLRAYHAVRPAIPGWERRRAAYQVWPLLVHAALFGAGYGAQAAAAARRAMRRGPPRGV